MKRQPHTYSNVSVVSIEDNFNTDLILMMTQIVIMIDGIEQLLLLCVTLIKPILFENSCE